MQQTHIPSARASWRAPSYTYRIREGPYRVIYEVDANGVTITIVKVAHRREVYRR
ncbi:MAG: type II toxin-antitoxin system RelE/ParE family toxin [Acidobacteriota bacterium]